MGSLAGLIIEKVEMIGEREEKNPSGEMRGDESWNRRWGTV
jgi:hypothetical protein